jgi:hypothetical protein
MSTEKTKTKLNVISRSIVLLLRAIILRISNTNTYNDPSDQIYATVGIGGVA